MSTKTTLKRIALVAVTALGFGLLSVTTASAADTTDAIDAVSITAPMNARVGTDTLLGCSLTEAGGTLDSDDTVDLSIAFLTDGGKPASSSADLDVLTDALAEGAGSETRTVTFGEYVRFSDFDGSSATSVTINKCALINADIAGTYKVVLWADQDFDGVLDAGEKSGSATIATTGAPASFTVTKASPGTAAVSTASTDSSAAAITMEGGTLLKIVPKDSAGNVVRLTDQEFLSLASSDSSFAFYAVSDTSRATAITSLAASAQEPDGSFYVNLVSTGTTTETTVVTITGGGAISTTITQTLSVTATAPDATDFASAGNNGTTGSDGYAVTAGTNDTGNVSSTAITHKVVGIGSAKITAIDVTDTYGFITGKYGALFSMAATGATSDTAASQKATFSITYAVTPKTGETYAIRYLDDDDGATATLTIASASATHTAAMADSTIRALTGSSVTVTATIKDAFGRAVAGTAVSFSRSGRNTTSSATTVLTNADGEASWTYKDAGTSGTSDTVTATPTGGTSTNTAASTTVNWVADLAVSTVVLTGGNTTAGVTATTVSNKDIDASADGASTTTYSITATVKDANGSVLVGAPVAWTVSGTTGAAFLSTSQTTYTDTTGVATGSIYGWVAGTYTVTATSGGKTGTATITFAQTTPAEARTISATVSGPIVSAVVKDRYGNPINNVNVYATKSGTGYFGNGVTSTSTTTNASGVAEFTIAGGDADVTVSLVNPSDPAGTTFGQSCAAKGNADCATTPTALTAYTAGTSRVAEDGVGASFDAAGVASATVKVTGVQAATQAATDAANAAADAAAEAIDAANAATDAANLAAEAADAATVAAEEARDAADAATAAVEELATQVATLMAALKAQITTLANTVAKIAKKVKA